jgi:YbbR domain-containing protein
MNVKKALFENIGARIIAVAVALIIWFNVSSQENMTRSFTLPVKLENIPDTLTLRSAAPPSAEVSITATKRQLLHIGFKKGYVTINLAGAAAGRFRQAISATNVVLPTEVDPNDIRIITPVAVDLSFERKITKEIPVVLTFTGSIPSGYLLNASPSITPGSVEVTGGESMVDPLRSIPSELIDLAKIKDAYERDVMLDFDRNTIQCNPERVRVMISVSQKIKRVLANVPPTVLFDERDLYAEITPKTVSLTLEGPKAILDTLSSGDVSILLDLSGKRPGTYTLSPDVIVPAGLMNAGTDVESLVVDLRRIGHPVDR